ncbi:phage baseplate assembly protein V [Nissabacter sp. SGAir0207]|uniref:phage baseplate assembly protein V n=1 Tax=Nissabacter sp. SGAir0207 TaxID=2126321 RepID=UPI0010CCFB12|nr:phage baseplate assembly protein V [Nissabacter sp. SGAir0207]QCR38940.1 baseplate assembly protein [Nissabacter sp. SGAir0207]
MDFPRLYRQLKMLLGIGRVTGMNDDGVIQILQYRTPLDVRGGTPRMAEFGFSSAPPIGSDVVVLSLGGDRSSQVIIGTNHKASRHTGLQAGESVVYNETAQFIKLTATGIEVEANGQPVTVSNATLVTINATDSVVMNTPKLQVNGDVIATGNITDNSGSNSATVKQLRDAYDSHTHIVKGVETGGGSVTSQAPGATV